MTRLQTLRNRRERLIELNLINRYAQGNYKTLKYFKVLLTIKKEINSIECINIRPAKALVGITVKQLFELNKN